MDDEELSAMEVAERSRSTSAEIGLGDAGAMSLSAVYDLRNGIYSPGVAVLKVIKEMTGGVVDLDAW